MHVFTSKAEHSFFIQQVQNQPSGYESLVSNDASLGQPTSLPTQPLEKPKQRKQTINQKKTKRGKGKHRKKNKYSNSALVNFSLLGSNSNGLKLKWIDCKIMLIFLTDPVVWSFRIQNSGNGEILICLDIKYFNLIPIVGKVVDFYPPLTPILILYLLLLVTMT